MTNAFFGELPGVPEGTEFRNRWDLSASGVHRPRRAGVCCSVREGAESIVLAGQYEDDDDHGDWFWYAGQGGRNAKTGRQKTDQWLLGGNQALVVSHERGVPIRVIRRTPAGTYRYDGLYRIETYEQVPGRSGFAVWRYLFRKIEVAWPG